MTTIVLLLGHRGHLRRHLPVADRDRRLHQRGPRRLQVAGRASRRSPPRPQAMQEELDPSFKDRVLTPLLDRFIGLGKRLTPADYAERIQHKLDVAGNPPGWTVDRVVSLKVVGIGVGARRGPAARACCSARDPRQCSACMVVGASAGLLRPEPLPLPEGLRPHRSRCSGRCPTPSTCSRSRSRPASASTPRCPRWPATPTARWPSEFARVLQEMQIGLGRLGALRALGERSALPDLRSLHLGDGAGRRLRHPGRPGAAGAVRARSGSSAGNAPRSRPRRSPVKIMIPLVLFILPCLFIAVLGPAVIGMMGAFGGGGALN